MSNTKSIYAAETFSYLPKDWGLTSLKTLVQKDKRITYGIVQPGTYDPNGVMLIRGMDYMNGWKNKSTFFKVHPELHKKFKRSTIKPDDILLSIAGYTGEVAQVPEWVHEANITQTTARISCDNSQLHPRFLLYFLQSTDGRSQSKRYTKGSAQEGLNLIDVERFFVPLPPLPEQQKIASILTSVDDVIEKTELQISKLQDLKKGMMQELLTKGIGHTEFKDSPVGRIPRSWDVKQIDAVAHVKGGKRLPKGRQFSDKITAYPYIRISDFCNGTIRRDSIKYVTPEDREKIKNYTISYNDLCVSIAGVHLGLFVEVPEELDHALLTENAAKIIFKNPARINKYFIRHLCQSPRTQKQLMMEKGIGAGVPKLALFRISETFITIPPKTEQDKIASILKSIDIKMSISSKKLHHIKSLKKALMQDLLTGKVRVKTN